MASDPYPERNSLCWSLHNNKSVDRYECEAAPSSSASPSLRSLEEKDAAADAQTRLILHIFLFDDDRTFRYECRNGANRGQLW